MITIELQKPARLALIAIVLLATGFVMAQSAGYLWVRWLFRGVVPASSGYPGALDDKSSKGSLQRLSTMQCWGEGEADEDEVDLLDMTSIQSKSLRNSLSLRRNI